MRGSGRPVWDDLASREDLAVLEPGIPDDLDRTPDVLVVGGGVVGLAVGVFCRRAGMRVLVVDRGRLAGEASGRAAGGLGPDVHPELGEDWRRIARSSLALHGELDGEWNYGLRAKDVLVAPDLRIPDQGHVDPLRFAAALARHAGSVATGADCTYTLTGGGRIVTVVTPAGNVQPSSVVFATGMPPGQAPSLRASSVKGHLIATVPASFELPEIVTDGDILVVQLQDGRLVAGGTKDRADAQPTVDLGVIADIERRTIELVPSAAGLRRAHAWSCFRPGAPDELPVIDRVPGLSNAWMACGLFSTGLLMAPIVGELLSRWLVAGDRPDELAPFSVRRSA